MNSKWGFNDGCSIPPDAEKCREVYCKVLNKLLEKNNSEFRIRPYDRNGLHNPIIWITVTKQDIDNEEAEEVIDSDRDQAWTDSVDEANEMGLDEFVQTECYILEEELNEFLEEQCPTVS